MCLRLYTFINKYSLPITCVIKYTYTNIVEIGNIFVVYYTIISQDSSIGRTLISCINSGNSNFSPGSHKLLHIFCVIFFF